MKFLQSNFIKWLFLLLFFLCTIEGYSQEMVWQSTKSPQGTVLFLTSTKKYLYAGIGGEGVYRTANAGNTWERCDNGITSLTPNCMIPFDKYYFIGTGYGIYRALQEDLKWERKDAGLSTTIVLSLAQKGKNIFAGTNKGIFISSDAGESWTQAKLPYLIGVSKNIFSLLVKDGNIIAGASKSVYISSDDGANWLQMDMGTPHDIASLATDGKVIYFGTSGDKIWESERLSLWNKTTKQRNDISNVQALLTSDLALYSGGNAKGIVKDTQKIEKEMPFEGIRSIAVHEKMLFAGTLKFGVWKFDLKANKFNAIDLGNTAKEDPQSYGLKVFPNPTLHSSDWKINYWLSSPENVDIQVFNTEGSLVYKTDLGIIAPGKYELNLDGRMSNFHPGMYLCALRIGQKLLIEKLIFSE